MLFELVTWWYGKGWLDTLNRIKRQIQGIWRMFSILILLKTLFDPWKRIISPPGKSLDAMWRALVDNLISRLIGFVVRVLVIIAAFVVTTMAAIVGAVMAIGWVLLPPAMLFFIFKVIVP
ncbi:MAG TPA: hypothetical protein VLF39_01200 [Candidatus Saccharimonadales bacterium]|nr:hypothetical protein [Candidatus Saccharimonadales bacterium]